jgi:hypothetical protein
MRNTTFLMLLILLAACATPSPTPTPVPVSPSAVPLVASPTSAFVATPPAAAPGANSMTPAPGFTLPTFESVPVGGIPNPYATQPGDASLTRAEALLDSSSVKAMESQPVQFNLSLQGSLPSPCHQLRVDIAPPDGTNTIHVNLFSMFDPNAVCAQVLQPFDIAILLGRFPHGHFYVKVNGTLAAEFEP